MNCNICVNTVPAFLESIDVDGSTILSCPICGSQQRHRALIKGFSQLWANPSRLLHIGPYSPIVSLLVPQFEAMAGASYVPLDFKPQNRFAISLDITSPLFNVAPAAVCVVKRVLEYIIDDTKAMENIAKSIVSGGTLVFETQLKSGATDRPATTLATAAEREARFGRPDVFRKYGEDDIRAWIDSFGFTSLFYMVEVDEQLGLPNGWRFIIGAKNG